MAILSDYMASNDMARNTKADYFIRVVRFRKVYTVPVRGKGRCHLERLPALIIKAGIKYKVKQKYESLR